MTYHFHLHPGKPAWAECVELPGCVTQAESRRELLLNMREALNLFLAEPPESRVLFPVPVSRPRGRNIVPVDVDPRVAFALQLRQHRIKSGLTQKEAARRLGMRNLYSYQRLERRANPSLATIQRVRALFPDLSLDSILE